MITQILLAAAVSAPVSAAVTMIGWRRTRPLPKETAAYIAQLERELDVNQPAPAPPSTVKALVATYMLERWKRGQ